MELINHSSVTMGIIIVIDQSCNNERNIWNYSGHLEGLTGGYVYTAARCHLSVINSLYGAWGEMDPSKR